MTFFTKIQASKGEHIAEKLCRELVVQQIVYRGITETAGAQELFINNEPNARLMIPEKSGCIATWKGMAYNIDSAVGTDGSLFRGVGSFTGERYGVGGATVGLTVLTGTGFVFSADAPTESFKCTVTPGTTDTVLWMLTLDIIALGTNSGPYSASMEFTNIP